MVTVVISCLLPFQYGIFMIIIVTIASPYGVIQIVVGAGFHQKFVKLKKQKPTCGCIVNGSRCYWILSIQDSCQDIL